MATHAELVNELPLLERMSTAERMRLAKKRRSQQLRKYAQLEQKREKELQQQQDGAATSKESTKSKKSRPRKVAFVHSVMLLEAGSRNDISEVKRLLNSGVCPDLRNDDGLTVLHQCCIENWKDLLILLLDNGADPDVVDNEMWTPLHTAAACGRVSICQILIERGADLLAVNADGNMAYDICQDQETLDFVEQQMSTKGITQEAINEKRLLREKKFLDDLKEFLEHGGDVNLKGPRGDCPLHSAASNGYLAVARILIEKGADVSVTDEDLWQPIHCAACWDQPQMLELLVENGANLDAKTKYGETPLDICEDLEMRQRILQLQKDRKMKAAIKSQSQGFAKNGASSSRRGSITNTRSASVRRSSTSQKKSLAMKEAKEEAMRMKMATGKKIDGPTREEKMKSKPNSMFKLKSKANSAKNAAKNFNSDYFSDAVTANTSDNETNSPEQSSLVRYRKSDPNSTGDNQKFIKNSSYKKQRQSDESHRDAKQQCCSIV